MVIQTNLLICLVTFQLRQFSITSYRSFSTPLPLKGVTIQRSWLVVGSVHLVHISTILLKQKPNESIKERYSTRHERMSLIIN